MKILIYSEGLDELFLKLTLKTLQYFDNTESLSKDEILNFYYKFQNASFYLLADRLGEVNKNRFKGNAS